MILTKINRRDWPSDFGLFEDRMRSNAGGGGARPGPADAARALSILLRLARA
jgi:hypothetical protein